MKAVILAGGRGTRLGDETRLIPKPMVRIGDRPIIWHIMQHYASQGINEFVIALGYRGEVIKDYFVNYDMYSNDVTVDLSNGTTTMHSRAQEDWKVTLVDTGMETMTGGRLGRLREHLHETFLLTYGDGLSDIDITALIDHHRSNRATVSVSAVRPSGRFGALHISGTQVTGFVEKPDHTEDRINGGFFVVEPQALDLVDGDDCVWESGPLPSLAARGELNAYLHNGFWASMDTARERDELVRLWSSGKAPWRGAGCRA